MNALLMIYIGGPVSDSINTPAPQNAAAGPLMLALTSQLGEDAFVIGVLYARLVRRGYRERAERAMSDGNAQGIAEAYAITPEAKASILGRRLF